MYFVAVLVAFVPAVVRSLLPVCLASMCRQPIQILYALDLNGESHHPLAHAHPAHATIAESMNGVRLFQLADAILLTLRRR